MNTMTAHSAKVTLPSDTEIRITREFAAPKHLVYRAYTTPELVERWWHAKRGTDCKCEIDLRVGGRWRYTMTANGGFPVNFHGEFREIVADERIVSTEVYELAPDNEALDVVTFEEKDGRTLLTILADYGSREVRDMVLQTGMEDGLQDALDLLDELAAGLD